jgi:hypothetical protein
MRKARLLEYDAPHRRLWIAGQRCHHGAGGAVVTLLACAALAASHTRPAPLLLLAVSGGALMAHDWKDHSVWFARGG